MFIAKSKNDILYTHRHIAHYVHFHGADDWAMKTSERHRKTVHNVPNKFVQMDSKTGFKTKFTKSYKRWEIMENHDQHPEETCLSKGQDTNSIIDLLCK